MIFAEYTTVHTGIFTVPNSEMVSTTFVPLREWTKG